MIKAEMVHTLEDMKIFARVSPRFKTLIILNVLLAVFSLFHIIIICLVLFNGYDLDEYFFNIMMSILGPVFIAYSLCYNLVTLPKNNLKKTKLVQGDNPIYYTFFKEYINSKSENGINSENTNLEYQKLYKVIETKDYFFFYTTENQAFMVRKNAFTEGTPDELVAILTLRLGDKFKSRF